MSDKKLIAIAAEDDQGLKGEVSAHFGRCPFYVLAEIDNGSITGSRVVANPHFGVHQPGVMPRFINGLGANVIIAGGMGGRALALFQQNSIQVVSGAPSRKPEELVTAYINDELDTGGNLCDEPGFKGHGHGDRGNH